MLSRQESAFFWEAVSKLSEQRLQELQSIVLYRTWSSWFVDPIHMMPYIVLLLKITRHVYGCCCPSNCSWNLSCGLVFSFLLGWSLRFFMLADCCWFAVRFEISNKSCYRVISLNYFQVDLNHNCWEVPSTDKDITFMVCRSIHCISCMHFDSLEIFTIFFAYASSVGARSNAGH